jgi:multidrug efflux pump subunit AcrB
MNLTEKSLKSPVGVAVGVGLIIVLGIVSLIKLPVQLFPDIEEPVITIFTGWRAAAPAEVESELIEPQERALRGLAGLQEIQSFSGAGGAFINLEFAVGTDMGRMLIDVIARMNQLPPLPRDADAPQISLGQDGGGGPNETLSWFFVQLKPGTPGPVENYRREVEDLMRSRIESIPGVGKGDVAERIAVRLGNGSADRVEVLGSLAAGDRIVGRGGERLRAGQSVTVTTSSAAAPAKPTPPAG